MEDMSGKLQKKCRKNAEKLLKKLALYYKPIGKRKKGHYGKRWKDRFLNEC
jgi:hypothetical protein